MIRPLRQLLGRIESLTITKQLETFRCRDITVGGVKPGEVVLHRRLMINNLTMDRTDLLGESLHYRAGRTS